MFSQSSAPALNRLRQHDHPQLPAVLTVHRPGQTLPYQREFEPVRDRVRKFVATAGSGPDHPSSTNGGQLSTAENRFVRFGNRAGAI